MVTRPLHGAKFDVTTGTHQRDGTPGGVTGAMVKRTKMGRVMAGIRTHDRCTYQVDLEDGRVYVTVP